MSVQHTALPDGELHALARNGGRPLVALLFAVYLALLVWTVLWKLHVPSVGGQWMREIKLVPFVPADGFGASAPFEVAANLLIFVPFGLYLGIVAPRRRVLWCAAVFAASSLALEVAQFVLASGSSDVTDVIVNTAGGLVGLGLLSLVRRRLRSKTAAIVGMVCLVGTVLVVVAAAFHIASFPQLPPPRLG